MNDIVDTCTGNSCLSRPGEFCSVVESGGTVAPRRHPDKYKQGGVVQGGFPQQAIIFSCKEASSLSKHFEDVNKYVNKMRELRCRSVPFGEDVAFQVSLYENKVLPRKKIPQFWGLGVHRIKHKSATKRPFTEMEGNTKESL